MGLEGLGLIVDEYVNGLSPEGHAAACAEAERNGFEVVRADEYTLLLDLDTPEALAQYERVFPKVVEFFNVAASQTWLSKSGNTHVLIKLREPMPIAMRLGLQAALGSDGLREVLAFKRMANGEPEPSVLFKPHQNIIEL